MLIDTTEYMEHLTKSLPDFNFVSLEKIQDYKENSEIYQVNFEKIVNEKKLEFEYRMIVGHPDLKFSNEERLDKFVEVAKLTYNNKMKEEPEEEEKKS